MNFELTREFLDEVKLAVKEDNAAFVQEVLDELFPADISQILDELDAEEARYVLDTLPVEVGAEIIINLEDENQKDFIASFSPAQIARFINFMESDDSVDILQSLPIKLREEVISFIKNPDKAKSILDLLHYEEDCAGGLMGKELIKANINWNVVQCIEEIRRQAGRVNKIYSIYVVDDENKLLGRVALKKIILAEDNTKIADIYDPDVQVVETYKQEKEVAQLMQKYDLEAIPVVNLHGQLLGRITIDDVVDVITEQAELERQLMSGISADIDEDDSVLELSRARLPWLVVGMVGGLLGAQFIGIFEGDLMLIPAMAFFIPLITATGGNVGIQSSSIILQSLADNSLIHQGYWWRLTKVLSVALLNGFVIAILVFGFNMILGQSLVLSTVVSIALFSVILLASIMGTFTPLVLDSFGINPALASGPFITTANDLLGLGVYFLVAHLLLGL
ncbi:magnesium transporter [Hyphobacterium sp. CCMP332]|nr:magnesium transporter [Hyphobacterium sp. CCMP332]